MVAILDKRENLEISTRSEGYMTTFACPWVGDFDIFNNYFLPENGDFDIFF